jgi:hypothetical protein
MRPLLNDLDILVSRFVPARSDHHQIVGEGEPVETWLSLPPMHPTRMHLWDPNGNGL